MEADTDWKLRAVCLVCRGYDQKKITENIECEIMQVIVQEAFDSYR